MPVPRPVLSLLVLLSILVPSVAAGQSVRDYALDNDGWNGLDYLVTTATEARVTLVTPPSLDLSTLAPDDVVVLLYPQVELPIADLLAFVDAGGFLIVADDRGTSPLLLEALGISRRADGPSRHTATWDGQAGFQVVRPAGTHFLFFNVDEVITNHPAAFLLAPNGVATHQAALNPILSFDGGSEHLVVEANHGRGKLIAVADPSVLLNDMLRRFYGNKQFAANLLRYPCLAEPCKAIIITPDRPIVGRFDSEKARLGSLPKDVAELVDLINESLFEASRLLASPPYSEVALALAALFAVVLTWRLVLRGRRPFQSLRPASASTPSSPPLDEVRGLLSQQGDGDFSTLAGPLANLGVDLAKRHRLHDDARTPDAANAPDIAAQRDALRAALIRIESEAVGLRSREPSLWSADRFLRLHDDIATLKRAIEAQRARSRSTPTRPTSG